MGAGVGAGVSATTIGGIACIFEVGVGVGCRNDSLGVFTLAFSVSSRDLEIDATGNLSARFRIFAIFNSTFLVGSPASRLGVIVFGSVVRILIILSAACCKKSSVLTLEIE